MQLAWLVLAVVSTFGYHLVIKLTPATVNPLVSLAVTYATVTVLFAAAAVLAPDGAPLRESLRQVNWTALALALSLHLLQQNLHESMSVAQWVVVF